MFVLATVEVAITITTNLEFVLLVFHLVKTVTMLTSANLVLLGFYIIKHALIAVHKAQ
jgi:hypothetical protein